MIGVDLECKWPLRYSRGYSRLMADIAIYLGLEAGEGLQAEPLPFRSTPVNGQVDVLAGGQPGSSLVANKIPRGYASLRVVRWVSR